MTVAQIDRIRLLADDPYFGPMIEAVTYMSVHPYSGALSLGRDFRSQDIMIDPSGKVTHHA